MKKLTICALIIVFLSLLLSFYSCSRPDYNVEGVNQRLIPPESSDQDDPQALIFVTLSGGGTRAAAMSWKALEELKKIPYIFQKSGKEIRSNLADQIDYISGISGGSFAAAAWCLYHDDMDLFRKRFIEKDIEGSILKNLFLPPTNGIKLISPYFDRIHIASELYDKDVFDHKTFGDLPDRPVLWINATHMALGNRFTYEKKFFDLLNSDLSKYPIGYACAASSAFPILLSPMTLMNYGQPVDLFKEDTYRLAKMNSPNDIEADFYCRARDFYNNKENRYMHLADGGLVDNQGLQVVIDQFQTNGIINKRLNDTVSPLKRLIIINVNAGVASADNSCKEEQAPSFASVIEYTMVTSMDILSAKRWMQIKAKCEELNKAIIDDQKQTKSLAQLEKPYTIEINFRNLDEVTREKCNKLPTSFKLDQEQLKLIDTGVTALVNNNPDLKKLKEILNQNMN